MGAGPAGPPRNRAVVNAAAKTNSISMDNLMRANFLPLNSVSQPATISVSASGMSNGIRLTSARRQIRSIANPRG